MNELTCIGYKNNFKSSPTVSQTSLRNFLDPSFDKPHHAVTQFLEAKTLPAEQWKFKQKGNWFPHCGTMNIKGGYHEQMKFLSLREPALLYRFNANWFVHDYKQPGLINIPI